MKRQNPWLPALLSSLRDPEVASVSGLRSPLCPRGEAPARAQAPPSGRGEAVRGAGREMRAES